MFSGKVSNSKASKISKNNDQKYFEPRVVSGEIPSMWKGLQIMAAKQKLTKNLSFQVCSRCNYTLLH